MVLGYTFKNLGADRTSTGAPATVDFVQSKGLVLRFRFVEGSSVGVPLVTLRADDDVRLQMVDVEGWATLSNPAYYDLHPGDGSVWRFVADPSLGQLGDLVRTIDSRGVVRTPEDMGVTVHRDAAGFLRQVCTPTRLADVRILDDRHYTVTVYPLVAEPETDSETGLFVPPANRPTRILDVRRGENDRELIVGFQKGTGDMRTFRYVAQNGDWTLVRPSGLRDAKELYYNDDEGGARRLHLVKAEDGTLLRRTEQNYMDCPWGWAITNKVEGLEGELRNVTTWSYYLDGLNKGKVSEKVEPNGNRIVYEYDALNRLIRRSMPLVEEETLYSYAPVDPSDPVLLRDTRPRCVVRKMQGVEIQRTYYVYGTNGVDVVERVGEQGAAYGGTNVLRTVTTYYPATGAVTDGLVQSVRHEDGTIDNYTYDLTDGVWTEFVTHVHEQAPDIVPMRTTRSVRVYNALGQLVDDRTDLCTIGVEDLVPQADWTPIERLQYAYDVDGNEIRREDLAGRLWTAEWAGNCCGKVSETDWQGITTVYSYDDEGRTTHIIEATSNAVETIITYNLLGYETSRWTTNRFEHIVSQRQIFSYDSIGRKKTISDNRNNLDQFEYPSHLVTVRNAAKGGYVLTEIDPIGRLLASSGTGIPIVHCTYDALAAGILRQTKDFEFKSGERRTEIVLMNMLGQIIKEKKVGSFGSSFEIDYQFDLYGREIVRQSNLSPPISTQYTPFGDIKLQRQGRADSFREKKYYNCFSVLESSLWKVLSAYRNSSSDNNQIFIQEIRTKLSGFHDGTFFCEEVLDERNNKSIYLSRLESTGELISIQQRVDSLDMPIERTEKHYRDGRLILVINQDSVTNCLCYDGLGRLINTISSEGDCRSVSYNAAGDIESVCDETGSVTVFQHDRFGRRIAILSPANTVIRYDYDSMDNKVHEYGSTVEYWYEYDESGNVIQLRERNSTNAVWSITSWIYDSVFGHLLRKTYPDGNRDQFFHDTAGHLTNSVSANGDSLFFQYDADGRLVQKTTMAPARLVSFEYDDWGRISSVIEDTNILNQFSYNDLGDVTNEYQNGHFISRDYDLRGNIVGITIDGKSHQRNFYDTNNRITSIQAHDTRYSFAYLGNRRIAQSMNSSCGFSVVRQFDNSHVRTTSVQSNFDSRHLREFQYEYDTLGNVVRRIDIEPSGATTNVFQYSSRRELVGGMQSGTPFSMHYDCSGNVDLAFYGDSCLSFTNNLLNQGFLLPSPDEQTVMAYDANGNLVKSNNGWCFKWGSDNQLLLATNDSYSISYDYDFLGRLRKKEIKTHDNDLIRSENYCWDGLNILHRSLSSNGIQSLDYYVFGPELLGDARSSGGVGGLVAVIHDDQEYLPLYDAMGNIVSYCDTNGTMVATAHYGSFGIESVNGTNLFLHWQSTKPWCPFSNLVEFQYRLYSPHLMRWISRDPAGEIVGGGNLYRYIDNNPESQFDYLGFAEYCRTAKIAIPIKGMIPEELTQLNFRSRRASFDVSAQGTRQTCKVCCPGKGWRESVETSYEAAASLAFTTPNLIPNPLISRFVSLTLSGSGTVTGSATDGYDPCSEQRYGAGCISFGFDISLNAQTANILFLKVIASGGGGGSCKTCFECSTPRHPIGCGWTKWDCHWSLFVSAGVKLGIWRPITWDHTWSWDF